MNKITYKCQKCTKEFVNSPSLEKHTIAVHEEKGNSIGNMYNCNKCARVFSRLIFLNGHSCKVEDFHVFIKETNLEPKIFDAKNPNADEEKITSIDPLDVAAKVNNFSANHYFQHHIMDVHC